MTVTSLETSPQCEQSGQRSLALDPVTVFLLAQIHTQDFESANRPARDPLRGATGVGHIPAHEACWETKQELSASRGLLSSFRQLPIHSLSLIILAFAH